MNATTTDTETDICLPISQPTPSHATPLTSTPTEPDLNPWGATLSPPDYGYTSDSAPIAQRPQPGCLVLLSLDDLSFIGALTPDTQGRTTHMNFNSANTNITPDLITTLSPDTSYASTDSFTEISGLATRIPRLSRTTDVRPPSSFEYRLSISDMSLHTVRHRSPSPPLLIPARTGTENGGLLPSSLETNGGLGVSPNPGMTFTQARRSRGSWTMTDGEGSFYTARGTLRSVLGAEEGDEGWEGHERLEEEGSGGSDGEQGEVMRDSRMVRGTVDERDVLVAWMEQPPSMTTLSTPPQPQSKLIESVSNQLPGLSDSPIGNPTLYLLHRLNHSSTTSPTARSETNTSVNSNNNTILAPVSRNWSFNPESIWRLDIIQAKAEGAFRGMIMPSISRVTRWTESMGGLLSSISSYLPNFSSSSPSPPSEGYRTEFRQTPSLYRDETIWTLRLPPTNTMSVEACEEERKHAEDEKEFDLGPTAKPILVKKRARLPAWEVQDSPLGWERDSVEMWR